MHLIPIIWNGESAGFSPSAAVQLRHREQGSPAVRSTGGSTVSVTRQLLLVAAIVLPMLIWKMQPPAGPPAPEVASLASASVPRDIDLDLEFSEEPIAAPAAEVVLPQEPPVDAPAVERIARPAEPPIEAPAAERDGPAAQVLPGINR